LSSSIAILSETDKNDETAAGFELAAENLGGIDMKYSVHINKGIWHVSFYIKDATGKRKLKQLSTGIKGMNNRGEQINKRKGEDKAKEIIAKFEGVVDSEYGGWTLDKCAAYCLELKKTKLSPTTYNDYLMLSKSTGRPVISWTAFITASTCSSSTASFSSWTYSGIGSPLVCDTSKT